MYFVIMAGKLLHCHVTFACYFKLTGRKDFPFLQQGVEKKSNHFNQFQVIMNNKHVNMT